MRHVVSAAVLFALATPAVAATYEVDPTHSTVGFAVTHMTVSTVRGAFGTVTGRVDYDPANIAATRVDGVVNVISVDTNNADRDTHLKSAEFFDADRFPEMKFASTAVTNITKSTFDIVGNLTIRGVTKEVTFRVNRLSPERKDPWGNIKSGTVATTRINRQDFGVSWNAALDQGGYIVGDEVEISLELELLKK